ncbi:MAG TPA: error-prone DNA polymerase [Thioalkalivibrio sp.]|nr:error-prone DNA polymerase [Thioalkalivibrio sp.]
MARDTPPDFAELQALSNFSFLTGASHPEELVQQAADLGYRALAITDECSLAGAVRAHTAAREAGLKLLIGTQLRLADGPRLTLLAMDPGGYARIARLITRGRRRAAKGAYRLERRDLDDGLPGCLVLLAEAAEADEPRLDWAQARFGDRLYLVATRTLRQGERQALARLRRQASARGLPVIASNDVRLHTPERRPLADLLTAVRLNATLAEAGHALAANAERHLRPRERLARLFPAEWLAETLRATERCTFGLDMLRYDYPVDEVPPGEQASEHLRRLTCAGMAERWPEGAPARVVELVEHELRIIAELDYAPYFLTVHDIVRFARRRGILCQGRGSAANSAVCYCLGITAVDPSRMDMLFERFISRERGEPPDIDIDFEHTRREEVIQYIYRKYGRERAALTATLITYRRRSALRDTARAFGLPTDQVEQLTQTLAWWENGLPESRVREAGLDPDNPVIRQVLTLAEQLLGFPRHLSQHVGGFVIAREDLSALVPIENAAMPERTVIQWDKDDLDALGLLKIDCLALGMLSAIHRCFDLVAACHGRRLTLADIPAEDARVYTMISRADTVGVFQIESRAQMSMLPRLKPRCFYDLVIEVAIVRPGPIQGQMVHPYLKRRAGQEAVSYPSEAVRGVLARTLGVPIFQEQVIKLAMVAAGFSAGEADQLRRAIGAWRRRDTLQRFHARLVAGMRARGYDAQFAEQIFQQIQGFGEYGFPESHAASFALLAYVSAWLKCHYPAAFTCALLNSQPMGFYAPAQLVQDARRHGVEMRPVTIEASDWDCRLESRGDAAPPALRLGLRLLKGLGALAGARIVAARAEAPFADVADLAHRAGLARRELDILASAGALSGLSGNRRQARWQTLGIQSELPLFDNRPPPEEAPALPAPGEIDDLVEDYASTGLTLGRHPLDFLRPALTARGCRDTRTLRYLAHGQRVRLSGLVITRQHPMSAAGTVFLTVEDEYGTANLIVWQRLTERYRYEILNARLLEVEGEVQKEGDVTHVVARRLHDLTVLLGQLETVSRDFR